MANNEELGDESGFQIDGLQDPSMHSSRCITLHFTL
jgi:hypothetical protein